MININEIESIIGYNFKDKSLLERAFIHSSYAYENKTESYERLEFLGDEVLGLIITERLYYTSENEGNMTEKRARIVSTAPLEDAIETTGLSRFILYGVGEKRQQHKHKKVLADVYEAIIGAIYLDGGFEKAKKFVMRTLHDRVDSIIESNDSGNAKGDLQEFCQAHRLGDIKYNLINRGGTPHDPVFTVNVEIKGKIYAKAEGTRIKYAERNAAQKALEILKSELE